MTSYHDTPVYADVEAEATSTETQVYGMCLACRSIEVKLTEQTGTRDFSNIGESAEYPVGYGCELCS